jgi:hypothetical protein
MAIPYRMAPIPARETCSRFREADTTQSLRWDAILVLQTPE